MPRRTSVAKHKDMNPCKNKIELKGRYIPKELTVQKII